MLNQQIWLKLPQTVRAVLVKDFGLVRDCPTTVDNLPSGGKVTCDGYSSTQLMKFSVEALQKYTDSIEIDYYKLWEETVKKADLSLAEVKEEPKPKVEEVKEEKPKEELKYPLRNKHAKK